VLACIVIIIFFAANSFSLFRRSVIGDYVVIRGECLAVTITPVKRRIKTVILRTEDNRMLKVMIRQKLKKMKAGTKVMFYVATNMPVFEKDGAHVFHSYLAMDINAENKAE
jgi:tRNA G37 N-methylase TrmD